MGVDALGTLLGVLALLLTIMGYRFRRPSLGFAGSGIWIIFAVFSLGYSTATWDIYFGMFWLGIALAIVVALETFVLRPKKSEEEPEERVGWDEYADKWEKRRESMDKIRRTSRRVQTKKRDEDTEARRIRRMLK